MAKTIAVVPAVVPADWETPVVADRELQAFSLSVRLYVGYEQVVDFKLSGVPVLGLDECRPIGHAWGPSPSHLIGAALGACLGARLLSRLREQGIAVRDMRTDVAGVFATDSGGARRIARLVVRLVPVVQSPGDAMMPTPDELLRESVVAKSIGAGIDIELSITPEAPARMRRTTRRNAVTTPMRPSVGVGSASPHAAAGAM